MAKVGRPKKIKSPEELWDYAKQYFQWADDNPWKEVDFRGRELTKIEIPTARPYTWQGFSTWLCDNNIIGDIDDYIYNTNDSYQEFSGIVTRIRNKMYAQKFEGAAVGAFNANIIARELGLKDQTEAEVTHTHQYFESDEDRMNALEALKKVYESETD